MTIVANSAARKRCPVCFRYLYICKLPVEARKEDLFYCCAVQKVPKDDPWHAPIPVDWNLLQNMVHNMCEEAGVSGRKNKSQPSCHECYYSVCCWSAWMSITVWTGHTSLDALRKYERVSLKQEATSKVQRIVTKSSSAGFFWTVGISGVYFICCSCSWFYWFYWCVCICRWICCVQWLCGQHILIYTSITFATISTSFPKIPTILPIT